MREKLASCPRALNRRYDCEEMARRDPTTVMAFTRAEAARLSGLSEWQVEDWDDLVAPSWSGSSLYTFRDLVALRTLKHLQEKHSISTRGLRKATRYLGEHATTPWSELRIGVAPRRQLCFWNKSNSRWEAADSSRQLVAEIALAEVASKLRKAVAADRKRPASDEGRLVKDRGVCGGELRFAGTRITVRPVVAMLRANASTRRIRAEFPALTPRDIAAARKLAAA